MFIIKTYNRRVRVSSYLESKCSSIPWFNLIHLHIFLNYQMYLKFNHSITTRYSIPFLHISWANKKEWKIWLHNYSSSRVKKKVRNHIILIIIYTQQSTLPSSVYELHTSNQCMDSLPLTSSLKILTHHHQISPT